MKNRYASLFLMLMCWMVSAVAFAEVAFDVEKLYSIKNVESGLYLSVRAASSYTENGTDNATPLVAEPAYFTLKANSSGTKYSMMSDGLYVALSSNSSFSGWNTKSQTGASTIWTIEETEVNGQYRIKSTKGYLKYDGKNKFAYTNGTAAEKINWVIEEKIPFATELEDGAYYRIKNAQYPELLLTESYGDNTISGKAGAAVRTPYMQMWKLVKIGDQSGTEGKWKLQNVLTGRHINTQTTTSAQFKTTASGFAFITQKGEAGGNPYFTFGLAKDGNGLHCASGGNVVNWGVSAEASHWNLQKITVTEDQLAEAAAFYKEYNDAKAIVTDLNKSSNRTAYHNVFNEIFTDLSCSELKPEYLEKNQEEQEAAIASLPEVLQQMVRSVKTSTWVTDKDETYNGYVKKFRLGTFEPYSDRQTWRTITNVGPFGQLVNPTGITVKVGEVICVFVEKLPGTGATMKLEIASGTEHTGEQFTLKQGLNAIQATKDGELFVAYFVTNKDKYVVATKDHAADFDPIRVHIEGGQATGTWDMYRKMTNDDWTYLCKNMFGAEYLHVKGESTVLSLVTDKVKGAPNVEGIMKIWDFIFETQERLIGHDGQWDGRYRPVITPRDVNASINPNWGGNCGTNHPSISKDYLFNFEKMVNDVGHLWEIYHEEAHAHQYPINLAATTESSNNGYAQMTNYEFGSYNSRNKGIETLVIFKNNDWGWVDILRGGEGCSRSEGFPYYDQALWLQCHMFYQLYQYFHIQGHMPDFWPRVADAMRSNGGITYGRSAENPGYYYNDYLKFAKVCAEVSQTDLWEFFDTWGFFTYCDEVKVGNDYKKENAQYFKNNDRPDIGVRFVGDYGSYYLRMPIRGNKQDEQYLSDLKTEMQAYAKKAPGLMFIDDHIKPMKVTDTCFVATIYPKRVGTEMGYYGVTKGTSGDVGMFWEFDGVNRADNIFYTIKGSTVTMHGSGYLGIKIYNQDGKIVRIYNTTTFTIDNSDIVAGLADGTYKIFVPLGNDTQIEIGRDKPLEGIESIKADAQRGTVFDLFGRQVSTPKHGNILIQGGKKVLVR